MVECVVQTSVMALIAATVETPATVQVFSMVFVANVRYPLHFQLLLFLRVSKDVTVFLVLFVTEPALSHHFWCSISLHPYYNIAHVRCRTYSILPMLDTDVVGSKSETRSAHEVVGDTHLTVERIVSVHVSEDDINSGRLTNLNVNSTSPISLWLVCC